MKSISKNFIIWIFVLIISFGSVAYGASSGTLGSLFNVITSGNSENGSTLSVDEYRLNGTNIKDNTISSYEISDNSLTYNDLGTSSVGSSEVIDNSLTSSDLASDSVGSSEVSDNSLTSIDLAPDSVGNSELDGSDSFTMNIVTASQYNLTSDMRYKKDIVKLDNSLAKILKLNGYSYKLIDNGKKDIGVIAQEVESIYPELVAIGEDGYKSVQYMNLIAPLIEAIKEQQKSIEILRNEVQILKNK